MTASSMMECVQSLWAWVWAWAEAHPVLVLLGLYLAIVWLAALCACVFGSDLKPFLSVSPIEASAPSSCCRGRRRRLLRPQRWLFNKASCPHALPSCTLVLARSSNPPQLAMPRHAAGTASAPRGDGEYDRVNAIEEALCTVILPTLPDATR